MATALVTGGAGFIGSHLCDALIEEGHEVLVVDDLSGHQGDRWVPAGARLFPMSVGDARVHQLLLDQKPEIVFHLAAQISVRESVARPRLDASVNLIGLLRLLEAVQACGSVQRLVFASTGGAIYGESDTVPTPETAAAHPISPYGCAKAAAETYLDCYRAMAGLPTISLRYSNVYGPRQDPHGEAGVVAIFARRLIAGEGCRINGTGEQTRDFVYVDDVVRANLLAARSEAVGSWNIGTGVETSVNRLYELLAAHAGDVPPVEHGPPLPGEQMRSAVDSTRARQQLGWEPTVAIDEGLRRTLEWFRVNG